MITGDITVPSEESLTIEAGVEVRFFGSYLFDVNGDLTATGTEQDSIYFVNHILDRCLGREMARDRLK